MNENQRPAMRRVTLHLDQDTYTTARAAAAAAGVSCSRWIADLIRASTRAEWPDQIRALAGSVPNFPLQQDLRSVAPVDTVRVVSDD